MSQMFNVATTFNADISTWDVSSVTNMNQMFQDAHEFNGNISSWDVSAVTSMSQMFIYTRKFNQNLSTWDVSSVTNMNQMFNDSRVFNGDISSWDVSNVTNMGGMFLNAKVFNQNLSGWCVSQFATSPTDFNTYSALSTANTPVWGTCLFKRSSNGVTVVCPTAEVGQSGRVGGVTYTKRTAAQIKANRSLAATSCTSGITDMTTLFYNVFDFNGDISTWDVSSVTNMSYMFYLATAFNGDLSSWDVSSVTTMTGMFMEASAFNGDLSSWDVSAVTTMSSMFMEASAFNGDLSSWDVIRFQWGPLLLGCERRDGYGRYVQERHRFQPRPKRLVRIPICYRAVEFQHVQRFDSVKYPPLGHLSWF
jgi:surface protein